ncbi:hypothetical protein [Rhodococcus sp. NPDC058521]|uniref:hypothetical protein n=1 Tax=Rhodococcus sp. NPDC058521 TaxID=3346536 RepID=UPI003660C3AD
MTEPIYVHDPEYFQTDDWSPEELRDAAQSMTPATIDQVQRAWTALGTEGFTKISEFTDSIRREIGLSWQGAAASNALDKVSTYEGTAEGVQTKLNEVAGSFQPIYDAASRLKGGAVPEVQKQSWWDDITPWKTDTDDEHYRRHAEAVAAMNNIYRPGVVGTDGNVPVIPRLSETVDPPNPVVPDGPNNGGPTAGPAGPTSAPGGPTGSPTSGDPTTGNPDGATPGAPSDGTGASPLSPTGDQTPATTGAASSVPGNPSMTGMPGTGASLGDSGRVGGGGLGGGSHGGGGSPGGGAGGLGGGLVSGAPAAGLGSPKGLGAPNGAGGLGTVGRPGAGGVGAGARGAGMGGGMMGGGGRGAGGNDDKEHKTPGYLVTLDNGNELIGKMPSVAPPVIGA